MYKLRAAATMYQILRKSRAVAAVVMCSFSWNSSEAAVLDMMLSGAAVRQL